MAVTGWPLHFDSILDGVARCGIVHIGAHDGREIPYYDDFDRVVLVEPLPHRAETLRGKGYEVVEAAVTSTPGPATLIVTDRDEGSSLLAPIDTFTAVGTVTVDTVCLDDITGVNVMVLDVQGSEVDVLTSGSLEPYDLIVVEASTEPRYRGGATDMDVRLVLESGFRHTDTFPHPLSPGVFDMVWRR